MSGLWNRFNQWLYPAAFRIEVADDEASMSVLVARLLASAEELSRPGPVKPPDVSPVRIDRPANGAQTIEKSFAIDLCNQVHRLSRAVAKAAEQGGSEAAKLKGQLDRLGKILDERSLQWEDLTGQAYDPGRADFETLGEPKETPGLVRKTIMACERPVVRLEGVVIQIAKGVVGKPPE